MAREDATTLNEVSLSSCSPDGESEDDVIFDKNSLLHPRKSKRRRRSSLNRLRSGVSNEPLRWKLFCLSCCFCLFGLSVAIVGPSFSQISMHAEAGNVLDVSDLFASNGFGFLIGSVFVSVLFTRVNPFVVLLLLALVSIPSTALMLLQRSIGWLRLTFFLQGLALGAIERGGMIMAFGIWKGRARVFFGIYLCLALGIAATSVATGLLQPIGAIEQEGFLPHTLHKRALSEDANLTVTDGALNETETTKPTRPSSALGIDVNTDTKTAENAEKRKEAESKVEKAHSATTVGANCTSDNSTESCSDGPAEIATSTTSTSTTTTTMTTTTTTQTTTTTTTPSTTTTTKEPAQQSYVDVTEHMPYNRGRNRQHKSDELPTVVVQKTTPAAMTIPSTYPPVESRSAHGMEATAVYVVVACLALLLPFLLGFCCCWLKLTLIADLRLSQLKIDESKGPQEPLACKLSSNFIWLAHGAIQAMLLAYLPEHYQREHASVDAATPLTSSAFWLAGAFSFCVIVLRPTLGNSSSMIHVSYVSALASCALFHHIFAVSGISSLIGVCLLGFFIAALPQMMVMWNFESLGTSSYTFSRRYAASSSVGRCIGPAFYAYIAKSTGNESVLFGCVFALLLAGYVCFNVLACSTRSFIRKRQIHQLAGEVEGSSQSNGRSRTRQKRKGPYKALLQEGAESDVDVEMDIVFPETSESSDGL